VIEEHAIPAGICDDRQAEGGKRRPDRPEGWFAAGQQWPQSSPGSGPVGSVRRANTSRITRRVNSVQSRATSINICGARWPTSSRM